MKKLKNDMDLEYYFNIIFLSNGISERVWIIIKMIIIIIIIIIMITIKRYQ